MKPIMLELNSKEGSVIFCGPKDDQTCEDFLPREVAGNINRLEEKTKITLVKQETTDDE